MSLSSISIKRPVLATVMSIVIVLFGVLGYSYLGVREYPSIDPPIITVKTNYAGANADVIESQITEPLEKAANGIDGIRTISSTSTLGASTITVEFNLDADLETAANDVRDKVNQTLKLLPQDIDAPPVVSKADANSDAILAITLQSDTKNQMQVDDYAENVLQQRLQTIPGVSSIQIWGQKKYAMRLWLDPSKLASYQLTPLDVQNALNKENVELPTGRVQGNKTEMVVRTMGRFNTTEDFNNMIITSDTNRVVRMRDVGYASLGSENEETMLKANGVPMIGLGLVPQPGANYIEIADEFYRRIKDIKKDLPAEYKMDIALDNTRFIKQSIEEVQETLLISFGLVVLIIFLFFRDWLIAFRPLIDIPVSLIGSFFIMYLFHFSINILTLLAIVLATGLVVDDGIVVTENIYKKIEEGMSPRKAAFKGSEEIFFAVISTSITLAAVFLPIIFLQGFVGRLFREFGVVVAGAVLISAFVSLSLTPMLNVILSRKGAKRTKFYDRTEPFFVGMNNFYHRALASFMKQRWLSFVIIGAAVTLIIVLGKMLPSELAPLDDRSMLRLNVSAQEGATYEYTDLFMDQMSKYVHDSMPECRLMISVTAPGFAGTGAVNTGTARIVLKTPDERKRNQQQLADNMQKNLKNYPEARAFISQEQTISAGGGAARAAVPIQYVIQTTSFDSLQKYVPRVISELNNSKVLVNSDVNLKFNKPEYLVTIDREKARDMGISVADIAQTMQLALAGQRFGYFTIGDKQYQVIGQMDRANRDDPQDIRSLTVRSKSGKMVQLDNLIKMKLQSSPPQLYHFNRSNSATISASLVPGKTIGDGIAEMESIRKKVLTENFTTALTGPSRDYAESSSNIAFALYLALALIYLVLAAQFESFIDPFIIMITVPLAFGGAVLSLWLFGQTLNIFSEIGIIVLIGLVTKNGILIVEFANQRQEAGLDKFEAVLEASVSRLRPILMTSLATILGALPIALALGSGAGSRVSLGIVIIGGLLFSLILTLFVIPAMYSYLARKHVHIDDEADENPAPAQSNGHTKHIMTKELALSGVPGTISK